MLMAIHFFNFVLLLPSGMQKLLRWMKLRVGRGTSNERLAAMERPFSEKWAREIKRRKREDSDAGMLLL